MLFSLVYIAFKKLNKLKSAHSLLWTIMLSISFEIDSIYFMVWIRVVICGGVLHMHPSSPSHPPFSLKSISLMKRGA
jgi:hypothetical protein